MMAPMDFWRDSTFLDAIACQEMEYIQVTHSLTELNPSSRSGFEAFQTIQKCQERYHINYSHHSITVNIALQPLPPLLTLGPLQPVLE